MKNKPQVKNVLAKLVASACLIAACCSSAYAADITKAGSGTDLTAGASWGGSTAPGAADNARWSGSSLGPGLTLGSSLGIQWSNIVVTGASGDIDIEGPGTLTNNNITISGKNMTLGVTNWIGGIPGVTNTIWLIAPGKTLVGGNRIRGTNTLSLAGGGTFVYAQANAGGWTGGTIVSNGTTAIFSNTVPGAGSFSLDTGTTLVFSNSANNVLGGGVIYAAPGTTLLITGPAPTQPGYIFRMSSGSQYVSMSAGSLIDVEVGALRNDNGNTSWKSNSASATVAAGAVLDAWDGYMQVDALNGYGTVSRGWSSSATFFMGAANGSGNFFGIISNNYSGGNYGGAAGGTLNVGKIGTGTQYLWGTNTYIGYTAVSNGTLVIAGAGVLNGTTNLSGILIPATGGAYNGNILVSNSAAAFVYNSSQYQTLGGSIAGLGSFTVSGSGSVTNTGSINIAGNTTISGVGSLVLNGTAASSLVNVVGGGTGTFQVLGSGVTTINGNLGVPVQVGGTGSGILALSSTQTGTSAATVKDGGQLNMTVLGATQWLPTSLTLGNSTGCILNFWGVTNAGTATAPIAPTSVTRNGTVTVNIINCADPAIGPTKSYPLLANWGADGGYTLGNQPVGWLGHLAVSGGTLVYMVDTQYDYWNNASLNSTWDILTSANWAGNGALNSPAGSYKNGDYVFLNEFSVTSNQFITVVGTVTPALTIVSNTAYTWAINSSAGNVIGGTGGLTKAGPNQLTLSGGVNTYSGVTTISNGIVNAQRFGQ